MESKSFSADVKKALCGEFRMTLNQVQRDDLAYITLLLG